MEIDPDKPGLFSLLRGEGEQALRVIAWLSVFTLFPLLIAGTIAVWGSVL